MVGQITYKKSDPNKKGRGSGYYWHRGLGKYSKYTGMMDAVLKAKKKKTTKKTEHMGDSGKKTIKIGKDVRRGRF